MSVVIIIPPNLFPGNKQERATVVNGKTAGECLKEFVRVHPAIEEKIFETNGRLKTYIAIYINNKNAYPEDLDSKVKSGDEIALVRVFSGG
jgi:molybdopterin converting factor small subunit